MSAQCIHVLQSEYVKCPPSLARFSCRARMVPAATVLPAPMALMQPVVLKKPAHILFFWARTLLRLFFVG